MEVGPSDQFSVSEQQAAYGSGYISIPREAAFQIYQRLSHKPRDLFFYLLFRANWKEATWYNRFTKANIQVRRGQLITSLNSLAEATGLSIKEIRNAFGSLSLSKLINLEKRAQQYTLVTIVDYDIYANSSERQGTRGAHEGHSRGTRGALNEERKEIKEGKKAIYITIESLTLSDSMRDFASKHGLNGKADALFHQMIDWYIKNNKTPKSLRAAEAQYRTFVLKAPQYSRELFEAKDKNYSYESTAKKRPF